MIRFILAIDFFLNVWIIVSYYFDFISAIICLLFKSYLLNIFGFVNKNVIQFFHRNITILNDIENIFDRQSEILKDRIK